MSPRPVSRISTSFRSIALLSVAALTACGPAGGPPAFPPPPVTTMTVTTRDVPVTYEYTAQTMGFREVEVRARVAGILLKRNFQEGTRVSRGTSLFTIDPTPFELALARATADLGIAEARHQQAQREFTRLKSVYEQKAVSQKEFDDATSAERIASAEVASAKARLNEARLNLEWSRVEAPITGIAGRSAVSEGNLVSGPSVLLTSVTQTDPMYVIFGVSDRDALALRKDVNAGRVKLPADGKMRAQVKLSDGTLYDKAGRVNFTDVRVNTQTGTSEARAEFPNPGNVLRAGEFVRLTLSGATRLNAIVVPQRAVLDSPKGKFVFVVTAESKAEPRPVEVGDWTGDGWIINGGLKPGDRVIIDGMAKLQAFGPGKVTVTNDSAGGKPDSMPAAKPGAKS
jgi:membrane fusion protein (multidrug efflux system)